MAGGAPALYVLLYRVLAAGCHLLNAVLIWGILSRIAPERRLMGTLLYAWNPRPLLEFAAGAHNDALMLTLLLAGIWFLVNERELPALVAWGASIAVKYVLIILLPFWLWQVVRRITTRDGDFAWDLWRRRALAAAWRVGVLAGTLAVMTIPFWHGVATLGALGYSPPAQKLENSPMEALTWSLRWIADGLTGTSSALVHGDITLALKAIGILLFVAFWLFLMRQRADMDVMSAWGWTLLASLALLSGWFWPWYATWPLVIIALRPLDRLSRAALLLAGGVLAMYAFFPLVAAPVYGFRSIIGFGPALGYLAWGWARDRGIAERVVARWRARITPIAGPGA